MDGSYRKGHKRLRSYSPIDQLPTDASLEEPRTAVAGQYAVVLAGTGVSANDADQPKVLGFAGRRTGTLATGWTVLWWPR